MWPFNIIVCNSVGPDQTAHVQSLSKDLPTNGLRWLTNLKNRGDVMSLICAGKGNVSYLRLVLHYKVWRHRLQHISITA